MALVTLDEMKTYLGIDLGNVDSDAFLTREINNVSEAAYNYCGRIFDQASYTQTIYDDEYDESHNSLGMYLYHYPLITLTSINLITKDNTGADSSTTAITNYRIQKESGIIFNTNANGSRKKWFDSICGNQRIEFVYDAGFATIPENLKSVAYSLVAERYSKQELGVNLDFGSDVQRVSIPGVLGIDFDYSLQANDRQTAFGMILGNQVNVLDFYRSERAVIGEIRMNYMG